MGIQFLGILVLSGVLAAAPAFGADWSVKRAFPIGEGGRLRIDSFRGRIEVEPGDGPDIVVDARMRVVTNDEARARRDFGRVRLNIGSTGKEVAVVARDPDDAGVRFDWRSDDRVVLEINVSVPRSCDVDVVLNEGSVTIGALKGRVDVRARSGSIYFKEIDGSVHGNLGKGGIILSQCTGAADLRTRSGSIQVGAVMGAARLRSISGDIQIQRAFGGVAATAEAGGITAGFPAKMTADSRLVTDGGSIVVRLDRNSACDVKATSSFFGKVVVRGPFVLATGGNGRRRFDGTLNGGGPLILADASGGNVKIGVYR